MNNMKKVYIPAAMIIELPVAIASMICTSGEAKYGNKVESWKTEHWGDLNNVQVLEDDNASVDTQTKGRGGDWGSIW